MHELEPYYNWRDYYAAEEDEQSPFYGREYDEFSFSSKIYNYFIHPQWDNFGSPTLYLKLLYCNYEQQFAVIELIGEWNDTIHNDIMLLKREIIDALSTEGINRFLLIGENVLNFHTSDDCYYEEWQEEVTEDGGWIIGMNFREHCMQEMREAGIHYHLHLSPSYTNFEWRKFKPDTLADAMELLLSPMLSHSSNG